MDVNTLGFISEARSYVGPESININLMIYRENTPYLINLSINYGDSESGGFYDFLNSDEARELGEKLIFLADFAEKANLELEQ